MKLSKIIKNQKFPIILLCFLTSFVIITLVSRNSFLYAFNDWEDANAFFTMGKGLMNGKVLYRDMFEQKGPYLFLLYGIGYLISNTTFIGIYFLEIIASTIFFYYIFKIINLYLDAKYSYLIIPLFAVIIYTNCAFRQGGSCEEFCAPLMIITMYQLLRYVKEGTMAWKTTYMIGFLAGIIFLMKYTLLGISFTFIVYLFFSLLFQKKFKKAILSGLIFVGGMLIPMIPWVIYFILNGALYDFLDAYILVNLFSYTEKAGSIIGKVLLCFKLCYENFINIGIPFLLLVILSIGSFFLNKNNRKTGFVVLLSVIFTIIFIYIGGIFFQYYIYPVLLYSVFLLIYFCCNIDNIFEIPKKFYPIFYVVILVGTYFLSPNPEFIGKDKEEYAVYQFKDIILEEDNPTILNYGWLDCGFYMVTGIVPNVKYFEKHNFQYQNFPENMDSQNRYIEEKKVDFVITAISSNRDYPITDYLYINYDKIKEVTVDYAYPIRAFELYKLKEDN